MPIVSGVVVPKTFPLVHSVEDVYLARYALNKFLEFSDKHII